MPSGGILKHLAAALLLAVALYVGGFALDQHRRTRRGPWEVTFTREPDGSPALIVHQPQLGIAHVKIVFAGEAATHRLETIVFDRPGRALPFGRAKFEDLTSLPGTVTMEFAGHEVELLPRTLYLNRKPYPWQSGATLTLTLADRPAALPEPRHLGVSPKD
jgi:hypothetical protein